MTKVDRVRKSAVSISTWFSIPEQGMLDKEILCRASAFLVHSKNKTYPTKFHVVTASHVIAPWRFPKYYPDDWLKFVNQNHTYYTLEVRDENGLICGTTELLPTSFHHHTRDVAILHIDDEVKALQIFEEFGVDSQELLQRDLIVGEALQFHGHDVSMPSSLSEENGNKNSNGNSGTSSSSAGDNHDSDKSVQNSQGKNSQRQYNESESAATDDESSSDDSLPNYSNDPKGVEDEREPKPLLVYGNFAVATARQYFAKTIPVLTYGMCGGPVTATSSSTLNANGVKKTTYTSSVCGMLEGIVPLNSVDAEYRGLAAFVDSPVIAE